MCGLDICVVQYLCSAHNICVVQIYVWVSIYVWFRYMFGSVYLCGSYICLVQMCGSDICVCVEGLDIVMRSASPHCGPAVPRPYFPFIFYICFIFSYLSPGHISLLYFVFVLYFHIFPPAIFPFCISYLFYICLIFSYLSPGHISLLYLQNQIPFSTFTSCLPKNKKRKDKYSFNEIRFLTPGILCPL